MTPPPKPNRQEPVGAAIVGLGAMGASQPPHGRHRATESGLPQSHASALAAIGGVEVVAVADVSADARNRFLDTWGGRWPNVRTFADHRELLAHVTPDLVTVATPDHLHRSIIVDSIDAGSRLIFAEKPLVTDLVEANDIVALAAVTGASIQVNYTRRFRPEFQAAQRELQSGSIGPLSQIVMRNGGPRAMLFRNTSHFVDLACYFAASRPEWVVADFDEGFERYGRTYGAEGGADPALEPGSNLYIAFEGAARAFICDRKSAYREQTVSLIGDAGSITLSSAGVVMTFDDGDGPVQRPITIGSINLGVQVAIEDLLRARFGTWDLTSPAKEAWKSVAIIDAALASQAEGNSRVAISYPSNVGMQGRRRIRASLSSVSSGRSSVSLTDRTARTTPKVQ